MAEQQDERPVPMEGRSRGPNIHSGGTQDIGAPTPPYEGRSVGDEIDKRGSTDHDAGSREISQEEREGVSPTDTTAASPHGVGESRGSQGNEQMLGESEEARRKDRLEASHSGVGRSEPIDPESPNLQPGDQGG
ncbi:MAG: hypothetical protein ACRDRV_13855 [Pseudonocardiaceae bacterium]